MAAERGLWPEHWRVADLDSEEEALLDLLQADEDLRAVVPGIRSTPSDGHNQVLVAVTNRRVVVVGRSKLAAGGPRIVDVTDCSTTAPRNERELPHFDGQLVFDVEQESIARMWARIDDVHRCRTPAP
jgi:hypothetical protein